MPFFRLLHTAEQAYICIRACVYNDDNDDGGGAQELQFRKLNAVKDDVSVQLVRGGKVVNIGVRELVVGDIVLLNAGDRIPADGVLVDGSDVSVNESSLTGESDDKKKSHQSDAGSDCFLLSGTTLSSGFAKMLVTAVGEQSRW